MYYVKILQIHNEYLYYGGEDAVVDEEANLLRKKNKLPPFVRLIAIIISSSQYDLSIKGAKEIKTQVARYGAKAFRFTDSLINGSMKAFRDMTYELSEYRMKLKPQDRFTWDSHFIVRSKKQMPPEDFVKMAQSGAGTMLIGVESGSPTVRDNMKKGYTDEDLHYSLSQLFKNFYYNNLINNINIKYLS